MDGQSRHEGNAKTHTDQLYERIETGCIEARTGLLQAATGDATGAGDLLR